MDISPPTSPLEDGIQIKPAARNGITLGESFEVSEQVGGLHRTLTLLLQAQSNSQSNDAFRDQAIV
jgi:hypothetical protein